MFLKYLSPFYFLRPLKTYAHNKSEINPGHWVASYYLILLIENIIYLRSKSHILNAFRDRKIAGIPRLLMILNCVCLGSITFSGIDETVISLPSFVCSAKN